MLCVPELLEGMRRTLEAVKNCALYVAGDSFSTEVLEGWRYVLDEVKNVRRVLKLWSMC